LLLVLQNFSLAFELAELILTITESKRTGNPQQDTAEPEVCLALDAGSCFSYLNPLTEKQEYYGQQVMRAAAMEQTIPAGTIHASKTFAAFCRALGVEGISFEATEAISADKTFTRAYRVH
jgi:hypothetical protein